MAGPKIGDRVFHEGRDDFVLVALKSQQGVGFSRFANDKSIVTCRSEDLVHSVKKDAWYLPGRVFSRAQRQKQFDPRGCERAIMEME